MKLMAASFGQPRGRAWTYWSRQQVDRENKKSQVLIGVSADEDRKDIYIRG